MGKNKKEKVVIAMSGGVDSSVAAALLKDQGYEVIGLFMRFWKDSKGKKSVENQCCSFEAFSDAKKVAQKLDIPIYTIDLKIPFKEYVVDYFLKEYASGKTPNPCIECNRFVKFSDFSKYAKAIKAKYIATGHYARKVKYKGEYKLLKGKDKNKDQSYFLYTLKQKQLESILFPVGGYNKSEIRKIAKKYNLPVFDKKDSQEVCFVGNNIESFLKKWLKMKEGDIVELETKKVLGKHKGLPLYTIGQRKGLSFGGGPYYVVKLDTKKNRLFVTKNEKELLGKELKLKKVNFLAKPKFPLKAVTKIRYGHKGASSTLRKEKNSYKIVFNKPQRAITPGQSAVFYQNDTVIGGGIIK